MDEPTNHLDIESREVLEKILQDYEGTLLFVSHDRYFIDQVADQILVLADGQLEAFRMSYGEYRAELQARQDREANLLDSSINPPDRIRMKRDNTSNTQKITRLSDQPAVKPVKPMDLTQLEGLIEEAETKQKTLDADILANGCDASRLIELYQEKEALEQRLEQLMQQWEALQGD